MLLKMVLQETVPPPQVVSSAKVEDPSLRRQEPQSLWARRTVCPPCVLPLWCLLPSMEPAPSCLGGETEVQTVK